LPSYFHRSATTIDLVSESDPNEPARAACPRRRETTMLKDVLIYASVGGTIYAWLSATLAPLVHAVRSCFRERLSVRAIAGVGLACGSLVLWTVVPAALVLLAMMLMPRAGLAIVTTQPLVPGLGIGLLAWTAHLVVERHLPRFGATFETASVLALVAAVRDDARTLARVEAVYRAVATEGSRNVKAAPPSGRLEAKTSPPWRTTMARTIESPSPLPEGTCVPAREASTL
jgi:hypothetical protein